MTFLLTKFGGDLLNPSVLLLLAVLRWVLVRLLP